jgi:hypothetical protein
MYGTWMSLLRRTSFIFALQGLLLQYVNLQRLLREFRIEYTPVYSTNARDGLTSPLHRPETS